MFELMGFKFAYPEAYEAAMDDIKNLRPSNLNFSPYDMEEQQAYEYVRAIYVEHYLIGAFPPRTLFKKSPKKRWF